MSSAQVPQNTFVGCTGSTAPTTFGYAPPPVPAHWHALPPPASSSASSTSSSRAPAPRRAGVSTLVALDGRMGAPVGTSNAVRIALEPPLRRVESLRLRSLELPLTFSQFSPARGNASLGVAALPEASGGPGPFDSARETFTLLSVPEDNYTADGLVAALIAITGAEDAPPAVSALEFSYERPAGGGGAKRVRVGYNPVGSSAVVRLLLAVGPGGALRRDLPAASLGWALGFRRAEYELAPGAGVIAEAAPCAQPLRAALVRLGGAPFYQRAGFQAAQAHDACARVLLPADQLFGAGEGTGSAARRGAVLCATEANGLLLAGTRVFRDPASGDYPQLGGAATELSSVDVEMLDEFGRPLDLQGATPSLTLEVVCSAV